MTSVTPICSNDSAAVEVVVRPHDDISFGDIQHRYLLIRIDYICIGEDGHQVSDNLQVATGVDFMAKKVSNGLNMSENIFVQCLVNLQALLSVSIHLSYSL